MATATLPPSFETFRAALDAAPIGEPLTPEQEAELAQDRADIAAGRARLIAHEDVPAVLAEMARTRAA
jgi:hypothetical protein